MAKICRVILLFDFYICRAQAVHDIKWPIFSPNPNPTPTSTLPEEFFQYKISKPMPHNFNC